MTTCTYWTGGAECGAEGARAYMPGPRCPAHAPWALAGRPEPNPDPSRTAAALRKRARP